MKLEDIRLGVSPLTGRIYLGTVSKRDPSVWLQKIDAVSNFCQALFTWCEPGTIRTIEGSDGQLYEIEVRKDSAAPKATPDERLSLAVEFLEAFEADSLLYERQSIGIEPEDGVMFESAAKVSRAAHALRATISFATQSDPGDVP